MKIDPSNLFAIHIFEPKERFWIRVEATDKRYTQNLSLHRHELNLKFASERYGRNDAEALQSAQWELQQLIADALPMALSIRTNALIARTFGVGTQHIFNNLGTDGSLGPLSGPFAGQPLNPCQTPASASHQPTAELPDPQPTPVAGTPPLPAPMSQPERGPREIPVYDADLSLGRSQHCQSEGKA